MGDFLSATLVLLGLGMLCAALMRAQIRPGASVAMTMLVGLVALLSGVAGLL